MVRPGQPRHRQHLPHLAVDAEQQQLRAFISGIDTDTDVSSEVFHLEEGAGEAPRDPAPAAPR